MPKSLQFTLYGRVDCHLCVEMLDALASCMASRQLSYCVREVDIDQSTDLQREYGGRIPVLLYEDKIVCEYFFDEGKLTGMISISH